MGWTQDDLYDADGDFVTEIVALIREEQQARGADQIELS